MKARMYTRIAMRIVVTVIHKVKTAMPKGTNVGGFEKLGMTPWGGSSPGNFSNCAGDNFASNDGSIMLCREGFKKLTKQELCIKIHENRKM